MRTRVDVVEVIRSGLLTAACSALLLSPAGAAQVDYFKSPTTKVPAVQRPETNLPAVQQGTAPGMNKASPQLLLPAVKGQQTGTPPSGLMGPGHLPGQQGKVFPKVEIHAVPPEQMPPPAGKPQFMNTADAPLGQAMDKTSPLIMGPGGVEPPPPGKPQFEFTIQKKVQSSMAPGVEPPPPGEAGEVMQKVMGAEGMNKSSPILMSPGAAEPPAPK